MESKNGTGYNLKIANHISGQRERERESVVNLLVDVRLIAYMVNVKNFNIFGKNDQNW